MDARDAIEFPEKMEFLFRPSRYKVAYGGRGGGKSWAMARALLRLGMATPLRIVCAREIQRSIRESVHRLMAEQIAALGLGACYQILETEIRGRNGTEITFVGLRFNPRSIQSMEGIDICWVEEATNVSQQSWDILIPTVRKPGSEIWVSFNPELETDATYQMFVVSPPSNADVVKVGWRDNPWFTETLRTEMETLAQRDYDAYLHVYEGHCRHSLTGAVFENEMRALTIEDRITQVPLHPGEPVHTFWDLGYADHTAIWFAQFVGREIWVLRFWQARAQTIARVRKVLQDMGYDYGVHHLPHDGGHKQIAAGGRSFAAQLRAAGHRVVEIPRVARKSLSIDAARNVLAMCVFDAGGTADGLSAMRRYRYAERANGARPQEPLHDENSDAADAFQVLAMAVTTRGRPGRQSNGLSAMKARVMGAPQPTSWMGA